MFHRMMMSMVLALGLSAAACVDPDAPPEPTTTARVVEVTVPLGQSTVADGQAFSLGPEAICSNTFCSGRPLEAVCYCPLGSGLYKASTCARRCSEGPPGDPTD